MGAWGEVKCSPELDGEMATISVLDENEEFGERGATRDDRNVPH